MELSELKITSRRYGLLVKQGIKSVEDVLRMYPIRYDSVDIKPFDQWQPKESIWFEGLISSKPSVIRLSGNRSMTRFQVISWDEEITVTLFNRPWTNIFSFGKKITIYGQYQGHGQVTGINFNFKDLKGQVGMRPVYSLTKEMKQSDMQAIMKAALSLCDKLPEIVPLWLRQKYRLLEKKQALAWIHFPQNENQLHQAIRTLKYEEFLLFQCVMQAMRKDTIQEAKKMPRVFDDETIEEWIQTLPYSLTADQDQTLHTLLKKMHSDQLLFELVQGDVGCGKTVVAAGCLLAARLSKKQAAMLAPTEILARQHAKTLEDMGISVTLYVASLPAKEKKRILSGLKNKEIDLVVGTHALFQEQVEMNDLGLVIVDEQQRFGVMQRRALLEKGKNVDFIMMSATPIPRTYAHFLFGDMTIHNIKTMPADRLPVITKYVQTTSMGPVLKDVLHEISLGAQCYVVCPAIEQGQQTLRNVLSVYEGMKETFKDKLVVGLLHGKMKSEEKEQIMNDFANKKIDILVSTTVIEVGIDVKNATVMVIYDAHRFGLSTLHQLRGRVGRFSRQGYCFLLSPSKEPAAIERLKKCEELRDGFSITQYDLQLRGPGDILGTRQSGLPSFILGDFEKDQAMMEACIGDARELLEKQKDPVILGMVTKAVENASYFD